MGNRSGIHRKSTPHAYLEDIGRKDQGRALLDEGSAPLVFNEYDQAVLDTAALVVGKGNGTYRTPSK
jgi:hypothetical protein